LIQQDVFGLPAGSIEHEFRTTAPELIRSVINQIALPGLGANVDANGLFGL